MKCCVHVILVVGDGNWYMHFPLTQNGATPLIIASQEGHSDVVNILIRNGADVNNMTCYVRYLLSLYQLVRLTCDSLQLSMHV